jgi:hypothetical protein
MKIVQRSARTCVALVLLLCSASCAGLAESPLKGGEIVGAGYEAKALLSYRAVGGEEYSLVETPNGVAMLLKDQKSKGEMLFRVHWRDHSGDHFAAFVEASGKQGPGYEFIVPADRTKNGLLLTYDPGTYEGVRIEGQLRPMPRPAATYAMTVLVPKQSRAP